MKILRLDRGLEKARNLQLRRGLGENKALHDDIAAEAAYLEQHLLKFIDDCREASQDKRLTEAGRQERIAELRDDIVGVLAKADKSGAIAETLARMKADLSSRAKKARDKNRSGDGVVDFLKAQEVRRYLGELRVQAKVEHEKRLARPNSALLSDAERKFTDPVEAVFLEACSNYDASKEAAIVAIESPPFPVRVLPPEIVQHGVAILERSVTPELASAIDSQETKALMYSALMAEVGEIVSKPLAQAIQQPQRRAAVPDGGQK